MKKLLFLSTMFIVAAVAWSQTNVLSQTNAVVQTNTTTPAGAQPKSSGSKDIDIKSKQFSFKEDPRQIIYYDQVIITNVQLRLTCERFTVNFLPQGSDDHPNHGIAETNLDIIFVDTKGQTNHLVSDKGIYDYGVANGVTNEMLTFSGHVTNYMAHGWMTAEPLRYNVITGDINGENQEMHFTQPPGNGTNTSPFNFGR